MTFTKPFKEITKKDLSIAGGKGASLGEMTKAKFPVPAGFVVVAQAYESFVEKIKPKITALLKNLDVENTDQLDKIANVIQKLISSQKFPEDMKKEILIAYRELSGGFVAARSSATTEDLPSASFAGQQATFLNVNGDRALIKAVQDCWASLFTARAIYYRQTKGFDHMKALIAVVVQTMVDARAAGVAFSVNPIDNNKNDIVIEASFGLGEAVVSGQVTPDLYIVHKDNLKIHQKTVNEQTWGFFRDKKTGKTIRKDVPNPNEQVLKDKEIVEIGKLVKKVEQHYKCPQDTEWAVDEKGKLFLLQARPITTLS